MQNKSYSLESLDNVTAWEGYSFDGRNSPSTGVLCKFADGTIAFFDPRVHEPCDVRFVESDDPGASAAGKRNETADGLTGLLFLIFFFCLPFLLAFLDGWRP